MSIKQIKPICPHCKKEIHILKNLQSVYVEWDMDDKGEYDNMLIGESIGDLNDWNCPECGFTIAEEEQEAIDFLNRNIEN